MNPLGPQLVNELAQASASGTRMVFNQLGAHLAVDDWLDVGNVYRTNCVEKLKQDISSGTVNNQDLSEYVAASIPLHCMDGWTFLARSLSSYINGNPHQAAHFAYYAELRAAMSILASQGIGVFNRQHFVINNAGMCVPLSIKRTTHEFVWLALDNWASSTTSGATLLGLFIVSNSTIKEWFDALPGYSVATTIGRDWLRNWGLDLGSVETDHDVRDLASYRPNYLTPWSIDARSCSDFLRSMWGLFEPSTTRFEKLDSELLRTLVQKTLFANVDPQDATTLATANQQLADMLNALPLGDPERNRLRALLVSAQPEPLLLQRAQQNFPGGNARNHEQVMARAALLLRVASGFSAQIVANSAFNADDLRFWTSTCGEKRAFWPIAAQLDDLTDLWIDVLDAVQEESAWLSARAAAPVPMFEWRAGREGILRPLAECDRVGLWSFAQ